MGNFSSTHLLSGGNVSPNLCWDLITSHIYTYICISVWSPNFFNIEYLMCVFSWKLQPLQSQHMIYSVKKINTKITGTRLFGYLGCILLGSLFLLRAVQRASSPDETAGYLTSKPHLQVMGWWVGGLVVSWTNPPISQKGRLVETIKQGDVFLAAASRI